MSTNILEVRNLEKIYPNGTHALKNVSFDVKRGEFLVIIGLSGSGKSTLLRCINRLHETTSGEIKFDGVDVTKLKGRAMRNVRSRIGMIFQQFNLIPRKTVLINVLLGNLANLGIGRSLLGMFSQEDRAKAKKYLQIVNLTGKERNRADNLSGGQQQRVAIARALMQNPSILLADEPVASLDPATSHSVMQYLKKVNEELGVTVICNLHFLSLVRQYATRVIALKGGQLVYEGNPHDIDEAWFKRIYGEEAIEVTIN
ncbi:MAG: phosphonate ABC transporter ATP-binding protein [Bdellovibrio sp. CG12_big_fil_rev_8_21_14_0_65_39_13]|nr:MAG: phosphonate ABC transporter ATP-binding protein [Bdellovibrio sp. CG22_combo_CG10-13_8_21_14_all_39_27]PIQ59515.1 MAG: phosphonate ABC transporter ATP-binding protein [Bdellovibrio sp. CG12_big_fil_rev_8_21_14_0_65_39_13]PIR33480.1 MAG: phosphonate ABC transporter ATP-binding protein [Bdellovibrio sp. CG11_big_fil_rev_8_21_14_0_20_39_38]